MVKPFVLNKENDMSEVKNKSTAVIFTDDEYHILMDALWIAILRFEDRDKMNEAYACKDLWDMLYKIRYTQTEEVK